MFAFLPTERLLYVAIIFYSLEERGRKECTMNNEYIIRVQTADATIVTKRGSSHVAKREKLIFIAGDDKSLQDELRNEVNLEYKRLQNELGFWDILPGEYQENVREVAMSYRGYNGGKASIKAQAFPRKALRGILPVFG